MNKLVFVFLVIWIPIFSISQNSMNMNLLGVYDYSNTQGSDIWGWVDGSNNEYALVCLRNGFSVVNVTNPTTPFEEFFISDINSTWRDVKTWGNYAYITTEANAGLLIVDLSDMTGNTYTHVTQFNNPNGNSTSFTSAHNIYIDENGIAYIFGAGGAGPQSNGAIFLDLTLNPMSPVYLGSWDDEYIHDGMVRGDTLWAGCVYEGKLFAIDVSDKSSPFTLGTKSTPDNFTHNIWVSTDGKYVFTTDEKSDAYLAAYNVSDLGNIQEVDRIQSNPGSNSIPHNTHVDGNFLITSYYRDGTTVHDITHPNHMVEVAYYDSYSGVGNGFDGCWGTYPFLPSGNIISSEINSGSGGKGQLLIYGRDFKQACYLQGLVADCQTGLPISQAYIEILNLSINSQTNLFGNFQTAVIDSGQYQVVISAIGYDSDTILVNLDNGVMTTLNHSLCPPCNTSNNIISNIVSICTGDTYSIGNSVYTLSGIYTDTLISVNGCDSVIETSLSVSSSYNQSNFDTLCFGQSIIIGNNQYSATGVYTDVFTSINGCDSIIITNLFVKQNTSSNQVVSLCFGDSLVVGNSVFSQSGLYTITLSAINGCDSVISIDLTILPSLLYNNITTICSGDYIVVGTNTYDTPGLYTDILSSMNGCDSVVNTNLSIQPIFSINNVVELCVGDSLVIGNNVYTSNGIYVDSLNSLDGCDSVITTQLNMSDIFVQFTSSGNSLLASANGGFPPYNYQIFGPNGLMISSVNNGTVMTINPTVNGNYFFVSTDALGCISDTVYYSVDFALSIYEISNNSDYFDVTDILGRQTEVKKNTPIFYRYKDGRVKKIIINP